MPTLNSFRLPCAYFVFTVVFLRLRPFIRRGRLFLQGVKKRLFADDTEQDKNERQQKVIGSNQGIAVPIKKNDNRIFIECGY